MFRVLLWKEYREHRWVWLIILAFGLVTAVGVPWIVAQFGPPPYHGFEESFPPSMAIVVCVLEGLVCGSMLLAGEKDNGTLDFLSSLAGTRKRVCVAKAVFGVVVTGAMVIVLFSAIAFTRTSDSWPGRKVLALLLALSYCSYIWGLLSSALWRRVIVAALLALPLFLLSLFVGFVIPEFILQLLQACLRFGLDIRVNFSDINGIPGEIVYALLTLVGAPAASAYLWCRREPLAVAWRRNRVPVPTSRSPVATPRWKEAWTRILWLCAVQGRWVVVALAIVMPWVVLALLGLVEVGVWPLGTLLIGVVCGIASFAPDKNDYSCKFLGHRRLPPGAIWFPKTVIWFAVALAISAIFCGPSIIFALSSHPKQWLGQVTQVDRALLVFGGGGWTFLLWVVYGFAFGQFFTIVTPKTLVGVLMALVFSLAATVVWVPSLLMGGVSVWQLLVIPASALILGRVGMWAWVSDRLTPLRVSGYVAAMTLLWLGWMTTVFASRASEFPDIGEPFDVKSYESTFPTFDQNQAGRLISSAMNSLKSSNSFGPGFSDKFRWTEVQTHTNNQGEPELEQLRSLMRQILETPTRDIDWKKEQNKLKPLFDSLFGGEWYQELKKLPDVPVGMVYDPRRWQLGHEHKINNEALSVVRLFAWRAAQLEAEGDPAAALEQIRIQLALARNLKNHAVWQEYWMANIAEEVAFQTLGHWLEDVGPNAPLLEKALDVLNRHSEQNPSFQDHLMASYVAHRAQQAAGDFTKIPDFPEYLVRTIYDTPWERERLGRVNALNAKKLLEAAQIGPKAFRSYNGFLQGFPVDGLYYPGVLTYDSFRWSIMFQLLDQPLFGFDFIYYKTRMELEANRLRVALALYRTKEGKAADSLAELVPKYLSHLPSDPLNNDQHFRYRVSEGEEIRTRTYLPEDVWKYGQFKIVKIASGQAILWSAGAGGINAEGIRPGQEFDKDWDLIFLMPAWTAK
jgi:ABC-type transport system involved in cytochrome c biogenesis permease component